MALPRFIKKGARFVQKSFNALVGAAVSTVTAAVVTCGAAIAFPFVLLGGSIASGLWAAERARRRGKSPGASAATGAALGVLASIPISLAVGLLVVGGNLVSPFLGLARGFINGLLAALIPSVLYYTVYSSHRERSRQEYERRLAEIERRHPERRAQLRLPHLDAEPRRALDEAGSPMQRARQALAGLARYADDPLAANDQLVEKISELKPLPAAKFEFLSAAEMKRLEEEKEGSVPELLSQYKAGLARVNAVHNGCSISLSALDEMNPCVTIEFKDQRGWHHYNYDADSFLVHVRSGPRHRLANLPENRLALDGRELESGEGNGSLQQAERFKIYKGFHADVLASLNAEVKPARDQLRDFLRQKQARSGQGAVSPRGFWQQPRGAEQSVVAAPEGGKQPGAALRRV